MIVFKLYSNRIVAEVYVHSYKPSEDVGRKNASDDISKMRHIIHVRKSRCYEHIFFTFLR